jgi:hypothetical protein
MSAYGDRFPRPLIAAGWIGFVSLASVVFSLALACAAPLAAIAALGGIHLSRRLALLLALTAWIANQAVGFGLLHYPTDATTLGWGLAIGLGTLAGAEAARIAFLRSEALNRLARVAIAFVAAFAAYEIVLYAAGLALGGGEDAFSLATVAYILGTNLLGFVILEALRFLAVMARVISAPTVSFAR